MRNGKHKILVYKIKKLENDGITMRKKDQGNRRYTYLLQEPKKDLRSSSQLHMGFFMFVGGRGGKVGMV